MTEVYNDPVDISNPLIKSLASHNSITFSANAEALRVRETRNRSNEFSARIKRKGVKEAFYKSGINFYSPNMKFPIGKLAKTKI